jgi:hypothetical protein
VRPKSLRAEEIAAACDGDTGRALHLCKRHVVHNCRATTCAWDGSGVACASPSGAFVE